MERLDFYKYLSQNYKEEVDKYVTGREIGAGSYVYLPVDDFHYIFEILEGGIKLGSYSSEGEEVVYDVLGKPDIFGNFHYLNGKFFEFAKTLTPVILRIYELKFFKKMIVHDPVMSEWFNQYVVDRWCRAETRLFHISSRNIKSRISKLKEQLKKNHHYDIFELLTQKDIADLVGASRQAVASSMKR